MGKKKLVPILLCLVLLLSGCRKENRALQSALDFRTALLGVQSCGFSAETEADFGDRIYDFTLECVYRPAEESASLTVTAPDTIAGISAEAGGRDAQLQFEDVSLELGTLAGGHVAPLELPRLLGNAWTGGYIDSVSEGGEGRLVTYRVGYGDEELVVYTYFNDQMTPVRAEVYHGGTCVLSADIENFRLGPPPEAPSGGNGTEGKNIE